MPYTNVGAFLQKYSGGLQAEHLAFYLGIWRLFGTSIQPENLIFEYNYKPIRSVL
jgi:hypothetical protein